MRKITWGVTVLLTASVALCLAPTTKPAKQPAKKTVKKPKATTQPAKVRAELTKKALAAGFEPLTERLDAGRIDWTKGVIHARGYGRAKSNTPQDIAMAKRAAELVAARNVLRLMGGVRVDARGRFAEIREGRIKTEGVLKRFKRVATTYNPKTGSAKAEIEAPLYGPQGVVELLGVTSKPGRGRAWDWTGAMAGRKTDVVVIDARELKFEPCLAPRIVTATGRRVFGLRDVPVRQRGKRPMVVYVFMHATGVRRDARSIIAGPIARAKIVTGQAGRIDEDLQDMVTKKFKSALILNADDTASNSRGTIILGNPALTQLAIHGGARKLMQAGKIIIVSDTAGPSKIRASR